MEPSMDRLVCRARHPLLVVALLASGMLAPTGPARGLVVNPYFGGHGTLDSTSPIFAYQQNVGFNYNHSIADAHFVFIDPDGVATDGGSVAYTNIAIGDWSSFDFNVWAPLWNKVAAPTGYLTPGEQITYGTPVPGVYAITWINVLNQNDLTSRNTFQVVFVGDSGFQTNTGIAIAPGSVIFAYGDPANPAGTVNLSAASPAAIGIWDYRGVLTTLASIGIGGSDGVVTTADVAALRSSGDPFLLNFDSESGAFAPPTPFASVPEPAMTSLLAVGLVGLVGLGRRNAGGPRGRRIRALDGPCP